MADPAMCGPSNALSNFQKQSTIDRTLQQDRLVQRPSPAQGFRSSPSNAGHLDPEFEAFQAGQLPFQPHGSFQSPSTAFHPSHAQPPSFQQPSQPSWVSDFQQMNVTPSPRSHQQSYNPQRQQIGPAAGGWNQEFAGQQIGASDLQLRNTEASAMQYSNSPGIGFGGMGMNMGGQHVPSFAGQSTEQAQHSKALEDEAFARAFDEAAKQEEEFARLEHEASQAEQEALSREQEATLNTQLNEEKEYEPMVDHTALSNQPLIGSDQIEDPKTQNPLQQDNDDALARTAAELLDRTANERQTNEKFKNSQFMKLMMQLKDKDIVAHEDQLVHKLAVGGGEQSEVLLG